jgi:hypothetical protein
LLAHDRSQSTFRHCVTRIGDGPIFSGEGAVTDLMAEETYGEARRRKLEELLRTLADRIRELDAAGALLARAHELMELIGDVRTELFHYEVRATYDTPEVAENRRIVADAKTDEPKWEPSEWKTDDEDGGRGHGSSQGGGGEPW